MQKQKQKLLSISNMEVQSFFSVYLFLILVFKLNPIAAQSVTDEDILDFALTLEHLEAEFYLNGAYGRGLREMAPNLARRGPPPPTGARKANLIPHVFNIIVEFGYHEIGHIRSITRTVGGFARRPPVLNLSKEVFGKIVDDACGVKLNPSFDPYANTTNYLLASYMFPYLGLGFYVGAIPLLVSPQSRKLTASLLGVEAGHDAVIRTLLYEVANDTVYPYNFTVANCTKLISSHFNRLAGSGVKNEGLKVPLFLGAENTTKSNILSTDANSLSHARTRQELLRILYGTGNEHVPGGFFPEGASGS